MKRLSRICTIKTINLDFQGWRWSYFVSGIFGAVVLIIVLVVLKEPERNESKSQSCVNIGDGTMQRSSTVPSVAGQYEYVDTSITGESP